jgi:hypothetical protein
MEAGKKGLLAEELERLTEEGRRLSIQEAVAYAARAEVEEEGVVV